MRYDDGVGVGGDDEVVMKALGALDEVVGYLAVVEVAEEAEQYG